MLGWKSFAVHDSPMSQTPGRHRMLAPSLEMLCQTWKLPSWLLICQTAPSSVSSSVGGDIWMSTWPCVLLWLWVSLPREGLALFIQFVWLHDRCDARPSVLLLLAESEHKLLFNTPPKKSQILLLPLSVITSEQSFIEKLQFEVFALLFSKEYSELKNNNMFLKLK